MDADAVVMQFLTLVLTDFAAALAVQILIPTLFAWLKRHPRLQCCHSFVPDAPEFNLADDLLIISYRQFVLYQGILVFPLLSVIVLAINVAQYHMAKYRLLRICQETHYIPEKPGLFLLLFMMVSAVAATLVYPTGVVWVLQ